MQEVTFAVNGMHCGACVRRLELALSRVEGAKPQHVEVGSARVQFDPEQTDVAELERAIEKAGFQPAIK
jgi:copper chaperone